MTELSAGSAPIHADDDELSLFAIGSTLLRHRRIIAALGILGGLLGLTTGLRTPRVYSSSAIFVPQGAEASSTSGLAATASQFGIRIPSSGGGWGPAMYVELIRSRALLKPIARDTVTVVENGRRRVALMDLLEIEAPTRERRVEATIDALAGLVGGREETKLSAVKVSATTPWPSVSLALAERMVQRVNEFNLETRRGQAVSERQFVELQAAEAVRAVRAAEDRLQLFLQRNRVITPSSELAFERDRLQREVELRQELYTSWLKSREEARIREVRDTPVITVLEEPRLPLVPEPRGALRKGVWGGLAGVVLGVVFAFLAQAFRGASRASSPEAREFFQLVQQAMPKFLRRRVS